MTRQETSQEIDFFSLGSKDSMPWTPWWRLPDLVGDVSRKAVVKHSRPPLADNQWFLFIGKSTCNSSFRRDLNEIFVYICYICCWKEIQCQRFLFILRNLLYQGKHLLISHHINSLAFTQVPWIWPDLVSIAWIFSFVPKFVGPELLFGNFKLFCHFRISFAPQKIDRAI